MKLTFTCINIEEHEGFTVMHFTPNIDDSTIYCEGYIGMQVFPEVATNFEVGKVYDHTLTELV